MRINIFITVFISGDKLPSLKIDMRHQIFFPGTFNGWFKGENEYSFPAHFFSQLITGKGFAKTHFTVPEKVWNLSGFLPGIIFKVMHGFVDGLFLLGPHGKGVNRLRSEERRVGKEGEARW